MATFRVKRIHPADDPEITLEADHANVDNTSGRINFFTGEGDAVSCVGSFVNATFYKVSEPAPE